MLLLQLKEKGKKGELNGNPTDTLAGCRGDAGLLPYDELHSWGKALSP